MATERIQIIVSSRGTVTVKKEIDDIGRSSRTSGDSVNFLKGVLATVISGATIAQMARLADAGTLLTNTLRVAGLEGQAFTQTQNDLFRIAKANGQEVTTLAGIYQRLLANQETLGISNDQLIQALENIGAGFKISSAGATAQAGALGQLQQLLGGTTVQMQEVNSLIDGAYPILQAVARGTDEFGGNVGKLINRLREGGYSVKDFFDGLMRGSDVNVALAQSFNLSIGQAITNFRTNLIQALLALNQATGAFTLIAKAINVAGNNLGLLAAVLSPVITALTILAVQTIGGAVIGALTSMVSTIVKLAAVIGGTLIPAIASLTVAMLTNPLFAAGAAVIVAGIIAYREQIQGLAADLRQAVIDMTGLKDSGLDFKNGTLEIKGDMAALAIGNSMSSGGTDAANKIGNAMKDGGNAAASAIADAQARGQAAQEAAIARYHELNGVVVKEMGNTLTNGGEFIYNQITGAVERAAPPAAKVLEQGVAQGGQVAGQTIATQMNIAGQQVGGRIAAILQASAYEVAGIIERMLSLQARQMLADVNRANAEASRARDEGFAARRQAEADYRRAINEVGGGGGYSGGFSGMGSGGGGGSGNGGGAGTFGVNFNQPSPAPDQSSQRPTSTGNPTGGGGNSTGGLKINNIISPSDNLAAMNTQAGKDTLVNVIKSDPDAIRAALGIL